LSTVSSQLDRLSGGAPTVVALAAGARSWSSLRTTVVGELLSGVLGELGPGPLRVIDAGGGTGGFAVPLAAAGHRVTVVDPNPDAMAALRRRYAEHVSHLDADQADRVGEGSLDAVQGDLDGLLDVVTPGAADLVLCHNVLEIVDDPAVALAAIRAALRPGGMVSLLVAGRGGAVLGRALAGRFGDALALVDAAGPGRTAIRHQAGYLVAELHTALTDAQFTVFATHAVRVFSDLVPGTVLDGDPAATATLLELERAVAARPDYLAIAGQLHVFARRETAISQA
jgi:S-adenosylmethionine-dependent methyltransferase